MLAYVLRRLGYGCVVVLGVLFVLFLLFFNFTDPNRMAQIALGEKASPDQIATWKTAHGYDRPVWPGFTRVVDEEALAVLEAEQSARVAAGETLVEIEAPTKLTFASDNLFFDHYRRMLTFDFGRSDVDDVPILRRLKEGAGPSLSLTLPIFVMGLVIGITLSLFVAYFRETYIDRMGVFLAVLGMSVSILLYIIGAQFFIGKLLRWFPISGFDPSPAVILRFLAMPILVALMAGVGSDLRFYRAVFVEESGRDYVRTARAKGAGDMRIMLRHVLPNALIPILTQVVLAIPFLFTGSILLESFFGIPGLGSITVDAIQSNDFSTLRTMVFISSLLFVVGQILTDISYALVDPRVRLS